MNKEFQPHFEHFFGARNDDELKRARAFQEGYGYEKDIQYKEVELELSEDQEQIIVETQNAVDHMLESYGIKPMDIPRNRIHLLDKKMYEKLSPDTDFRAEYTPFQFRVVLAKHNTDVGFSHLLAHELLHAKSYHAGKVDASDTKLTVHNKPHRHGVAISRKVDDGYIDFFGEIDEAITEELNNQVYDEYTRNNPRYKDEIEKVEKVKSFLLGELVPGQVADNTMPYQEIVAIEDIQRLSDIIDTNIPDKDKYPLVKTEFNKLVEDDKVIKSSYYWWRSKFEDLLEEIHEASQGAYATPHDVFKVFVQAQFTGKLLSLARSLEKHLGKDNFRAIAENSKMIDSDKK